MAEAQRFECPGRYFGRYCTDEREYNYARILESSNKHTLKMLNSIKSPEESEVVINARKASENFRNLLKQLKEQGLIEE